MDAVLEFPIYYDGTSRVTLALLQYQRSTTAPQNEIPIMHSRDTQRFAPPGAIYADTGASFSISGDTTFYRNTAIDHGGAHPKRMIGLSLYSQVSADHPFRLRNLTLGTNITSMYMQHLWQASDAINFFDYLELTMATPSRNESLNDWRGAEM